MIKTKSLFYEMRMRKTHVIVVYARIRTLHEANVPSLMASKFCKILHFRQQWAWLIKCERA